MCHGMPAGVVRVKGVLAFDEDRLTRSGLPGTSTVTRGTSFWTSEFLLSHLRTTSSEGAGWA